MPIYSGILIPGDVTILCDTADVTGVEDIGATTT